MTKVDFYETWSALLSVFGTHPLILQDVNLNQRKLRVDNCKGNRTVILDFTNSESKRTCKDFIHISKSTHLIGANLPLYIVIYLKLFFMYASVSRLSFESFNSNLAAMFWHSFSDTSPRKRLSIRTRVLSCLIRN